MTFVNQVFSYSHLMNVNIIKSLCVVVGLITVCLGPGNATRIGTRSGKSSLKYLFVFLSYLSISAIFTW